MHATLYGVGNERGREVEQFIAHNNINVMNNGAPTRIVDQAESAIDLLLCSPQLDTDLQWSVLSSPGGSDHCPIIISYNYTQIQTFQYWCIKKARWGIYETSASWTELSTTPEGDNNNLTNDFYNRLTYAATEAIPKTELTKYLPKPWWSTELKELKIRRERFYQQYRRNRTITNLILWRKTKPQHKQLIKKHKQDSWAVYRDTSVKGTSIHYIRGSTQNKGQSTTKNLHLTRQQSDLLSDTRYCKPASTSF